MWERQLRWDRSLTLKIITILKFFKVYRSLHISISHLTLVIKQEPCKYINKVQVCFRASKNSFILISNFLQDRYHFCYLIDDELKPSVTDFFDASFLYTSYTRVLQESKSVWILNWKLKWDLNRNSAVFNSIMEFQLCYWTYLTLS